MDNLPSFQRSVGKLFDSRKKKNSQKEHKKSQNNSDQKLVMATDNNKSIPTTIITTSSTSKDTVAKSTGAIKKQPTTLNPSSSSNSRLRFFQRSSRTKSTTSDNIAVDDNSPHVELPPSDSKSMRNEHALVERFRRLQLTKNASMSSKHHSLELQPSVEYLDGTITTTTTSTTSTSTTTRPAHMALKQLRSFDVGTTYHYQHHATSGGLGGLGAIGAIGGLGGGGGSSNSSGSIIAFGCGGSPDEPTPPEFGYQHLGGSSVATTNSNTSLESCSYIDMADTLTTVAKTTTTTTKTQQQQSQQKQQSKQEARNSGASASVCYWAWQQTIATVATTTASSSSTSKQHQPSINDTNIKTPPPTTTTTTTGGGGGSKDGRRGGRSPLLKMPVIKQLSAQQQQSPLPSPATTATTTVAITNNHTLDEQLCELELNPITTIATTTTTIASAAKSNSSSKAPSRSGSASKLMSFLFKSSNESNKSLQGLSNEGFTASSHGSSSGEWECLGNTALGGAARFEIESLPEEHHGQQQQQQQHLLQTDEAGSYFQYTLSSPSNPFIPEIVAHSYNNNSNNNRDRSDGIDDMDFELGGIMHARSQLPTPCYSRAGSQESTHSDGIASTLSDNVSSGATSSLGAGRQRRKLFSLHSPRFFQHQHQSEGSSFNMSVKATTTTSTTTTTTTTTSITAATTTTTGSSDQNSFMRSLNPFSGSRRGSTHGAVPKCSQTTAAAAGTPVDMQAKREEFLRATMKICLVVSPPSNKLQIKSKSLTHLDGLGPTFAYNQKNHHNHHHHHHHHHNNNNNDYNDDECKKAAVGGPVPLLQNLVDMAHASAICATLLPGILNHTEAGTEYFQVSFCLDPSATEDYELISVKKGLKLSNALSSTLKKRNLSFSKINIFDNTASDFLDTEHIVQSLDKNTSVERLTGHHLIVTPRDNNRKTTLQKAASFGARSRPTRLLSSASTEETSEPAPSTSSTANGTSGSASVGKVKQRWSGLFGAKNAQYVQLCEILNVFSRSGVPQQPETILYLDHPNFADAMQYLSNIHSSWTDFVDCENMNDNDKRIQTAIWELVTTEVFYIQTLQTVTNLFLACLLAVQDQHILSEIDQNKLFSNVREICFANLRFWTMSLYPMVAHSVATREPMRIVFFQQGFASFGALFAPYKRYCAEQSTCQYYCKELYRSNVLFTSYLAWCESHKMCNRLRLADILVRPMQRLTKYSLLLSAIRKQLYNMQDVELLDYMIQSVENFVCSVNSHLTIRQEHERLKGVMARIESYDVVPETNNEQLDRMLRQFSRMFDLCMPMKGCPAHHVRHLFMEGDHKYKDNTGKIDVHCFLMTDMLIVCKAMSKKSVGQLKVIRQPYITDRLVVHLQNNVLSCVYLNEYQVAVSAFTMTSLEARSWYDSLKRARNVYTRLKQSVHNLTATGVTGGPTNTTHPGATEGGSSFMSDFPPYSHAYASYHHAATHASGISVGSEALNASSGNIDGNLGISAASVDPLSLILRKSPMSSSSVGSHISSTNASKSGSVEWNESRNISVEMEKTNSLSSDDGATALTGSHGVMAALIKGKNLLTGHKTKLALSTMATTTAIATNSTTTTTTGSASTSNRLSVQQPFISHLGQSLPNLTTHQSQTSNLYHTYSNNTLLVPSTTSTHSGNLLLSPSHRGISYPPPSPTRVPLRRGLAFSTSTKNPPLVKSRNITSQNSFSWRQMFSPTVQQPQPQPPPPTPLQTATISTSTTTTAGSNIISPPSPHNMEYPPPHTNLPLTTLSMGSSLDTHLAYVGATGGYTLDTSLMPSGVAQTLATGTTPLLLTTDDIAEETAEHLMHY